MNNRKNNSIGRPSIGISPEDYIQQYYLLGSWSLVARFFGVSRQTIWKVLKESGYKKSYSR